MASVNPEQKMNYVEWSQAEMLRLREERDQLIDALNDFGIRVTFDAENMVGIDVSGFHLHDGGKYTNLPPLTEVESLRAMLFELLAAFSRMPDAGFTDTDPRWAWWNETADVRRRAREALGLMAKIAGAKWHPSRYGRR